MDNFVDEIRYAFRQLRRSPAFAFTAILTLALGIGANTAIFTVVQSLLLKPLEYPEADRIVAVNTLWEHKAKIHPRMTGPDLVDIRAQAKSIEALGFYQGGELGVQLRDHATFTGVSFVDPGFARVFQITPEAGRWFSDAEANHAAVVNATFARNNFGSAQAAVGQILKIDGHPMEIVGVVSGSFEFPKHTQIWSAESAQPESMERTAFNYQAVARMRRGVSLSSAQAELDGIGKRLQAAYPKANEDKSFKFVPLQEQLVGSVRPMLLLLMASVGLVLLIACVNVTHLYLARAVERQRELAVRTALGSSRLRLGRMVVLESLLLSSAGAVLGILIAAPIVRLLVSMAPAGLPRAGEIQLNFWVFAFTAAIALIATLMASLLPARKAARVDPIAALQQDSSRGMSSRHSFLLRNGLVIAEVAAAFVLAVGASLLARTMLNLQSSNLGYSKTGLLIVDADAPAVSLDDAIAATRRFDAIFADLKTLPGVESVGGVMGLPLGKYGSNGNYGVNGKPLDSNSKDWAIFTLASPGYFKTMEIPLLRGRDFAAQDAYNAPLVAIISESVARQSFPGQDPIGHQIECGLDAPGKGRRTIIGIVRDLRQDSPADSPGPALYMPLAQNPFMATQINIAIRTKVAPASLIDTVQAKIHRADAGIATRFTTMDAMVGESVQMQRFRGVLVGSFAGVGLLLAVLGVYGTVAYSVAQRTFEIGVRMAFGAERESILKMVLLQVLVLASIGIVTGLALSLLAGRFIASMLSGVSPADPLSLGAAMGILIVAALGAALVPARAASSVEPMQALRGL
jgi:putative ABC transport system permease protein